MIMVWIKTATIFVASVSMLAAAVRHREWRGGLLLLSCVFMSAAMNESETFFGKFFPIDESDLPAILFFLVLGAVLAAVNRGTTIVALKAVYVNRRFPFLVWGLCLVSFLPQIGTDKHIWALLLPSQYSTREVRELVEHGIEFFGYIFLLNWAILFLKDKWRVLTRRVPSEHEYLLKEQPWERVGWGGTRRACFRLGDSGFCVKFYKPVEDCVPGKMKPSIRREIGWRRFNKYRNCSSEEVHIYNRLRHSIPEAWRSKLPPVCERVFHPEYGWGVLETYYANPDGTAVIPYEFEIERQAGNPELQASIYRQARDLLLLLIECRACFHEPGNFHVLLDGHNNAVLKLVDFEPESKTFLRVEMVVPPLRARKLARKAKRYLGHIRTKYRLDIPIETAIG